jgi:hypothetical protein
MQITSAVSTPADNARGSTVIAAREQVQKNMQTSGRSFMRKEGDRYARKGDEGWFVDEMKSF